MHLLLLLLLLTCPLYSQSLDMYVETGFHMEDLTLDLNKKSALQENFDRIKWNQIMAPEIRLGACYRFIRAFSIEAEGGFLLEAPASNQFSGSYREDIGSRPFTCRTHHKGNVSGNDFSLAAGYSGNITAKLLLTSLVGYAEQRRKLHLHPGKFTTHVDAVNDPQGVDSLNLCYSASWKGPWIGLRLGYELCQGLCFMMDAEYHRTLLRADGHWHLQELMSDGFTFDSRISTAQKGTASGFKVNASFVKELCAKWRVILHGYYERLVKKDGKDSTKNTQQVFTSAGTPIAQGSFQHTPRYRVQWQAWAILGGIDYEF